MTEFLAVCVRPPGNELVAAECEHLTGGRPDYDGLADCRTLEYIPRAAYITTGARRIAEGETLEALTAAIARQSFAADDFRIEFLRFSDRVPFHQFDAVIAVADAIQSFPNLDHPHHRFLLIVRDSGFWFGEILAESDGSYHRHDGKPYRTSSSLSSQMARALVNLVSPEAQSILDPCCGTGSILLEAQSLGLAAHGADRNPRMVGMSRRNLAHFGYSAEVKYLDACKYTRTADALVTDLPYGRYLERDDQNIRNILAHARRLAPLAVYVAGSDISDWLQEAGYRDVEVSRITRSIKFTRYIHRARSDG